MKFFPERISEWYLSDLAFLVVNAMLEVGSRFPEIIRILGNLQWTCEDRLDAIEEQLVETRIALSFPQSPRFVKLKGLWKGLRVSRDDLAEAKISLFRNASK
jgi:hypothetical protein